MPRSVKGEKAWFSARHGGFFSEALYSTTAQSLCRVAWCRNVVNRQSSKGSLCIVPKKNWVLPVPGVPGVNPHKTFVFLGGANAKAQAAESKVGRPLPTFRCFQTFEPGLLQGVDFH